MEIELSPNTVDFLNLFEILSDLSTGTSELRDDCLANRGDLSTELKPKRLGFSMTLKIDLVALGYLAAVADKGGCTQYLAEEIVLPFLVSAKF